MKLRSLFYRLSRNIFLAVILLALLYAYWPFKPHASSELPIVIENKTDDSFIAELNYYHIFPREHILAASEVVTLSPLSTSYASHPEYDGAIKTERYLKILHNGNTICTYFLEQWNKAAVLTIQRDENDRLSLYRQDATSAIRRIVEERVGYCL